ncbi:MAG: anti-sigma factor antagonist [Streptosporangiales bacterium]|nr:anti-sigma factor antagonist [Streptosporangiales bacterium]
MPGRSPPNSRERSWSSVPGPGTYFRWNVRTRSPTTSQQWSSGRLDDLSDPYHVRSRIENGTRVSWVRTSVSAVAFVVATKRRGPRVVVRVEGEIDLLTAPKLRQTLSRAIREQSPHIVVDLTGVLLCGSMGLTVLRTAGLRATAKGGSLTLAGPRPTVRKVLTVSGYAKIFPVYDDLEAALSDDRLN